MCALPQTYIGGMEEKQPKKGPGANAPGKAGSRTVRWPCAASAASEGERVHAAAARDVMFWVGRLRERAREALLAGIDPDEF